MRRRVRLGVLGVVLALVVVAGLVLSGSLRARSDLVAFEDHLGDVVAALLDDRTDDAVVSLIEAEKQATAAAGRTDGPAWWVATHIPVLGRSPRIVQAASQVADRSIEPAQALVDAYLAIADRPALVDGAIDLDVLGDFSSAVTAVDLGPLTAAVAALDATASTFVPSKVREARRDAVDRALPSLADLQSVRNLAGVLPRFLGADGPRSYFLALMNPSELRSLGGLTSIVGIITIDDGELVVEPFFDATTVTSFFDTQYEGADVSDVFLQRYAAAGAQRNLVNAGVDPDLPTVAPIFLQILQDLRGRDLDGVIAMDPVGLQAVLRGHGSLDVPYVDGVGESQSRVVPVNMIAQVALVDAYVDFEGDERGRDAFLAGLSHAAVSAITRQEGGLPDLFTGIVEATDGRHLMLNSTFPDEQAAFEAAGVAGQLDPGDPLVDLVAITATNSAANKMDAWLGHTITGQVVVDVPGDVASHAGAFLGGERRTTLTVQVDNPLPTTGLPEAIIGSQQILTTGAGNYDPEGVGLSRTWFTAWAPGDARFTAGNANGTALVPSPRLLHGRRPIDHVLTARSMTSASFDVAWEGPVVLRKDGPDGTYDWRWRRQGKAIADVLDIAFLVPEGWEVAAVEVENHAGGVIIGMHRDVPGVVASIEDDHVRLHGATTSDVTIRIRLRRGFSARLSDWIAGFW